MSTRNVKLIDLERVRALRVSTSPWQMSVRDAPRVCDPARLYRLMIVVSPGANKIRYMMPTPRPYGHEGELVRALEAAMLQGRDSNLPPARPPRIIVDDEEIAARIRDAMSACGVGVQVEERCDAIDPVLEVLGMRPQVLSDGTLLGASILEAELAEVAARVAAGEPWRRLPPNLPLRLIEAGTEPSELDRVLVVSGALGEPEGVASFSLRAFSRGLSSLRGGDGLVGDAAESDPSWTLSFERSADVPAEVRHAFSRHGLPAPHGLYPRYASLQVGLGPGDVESEEHAAAFAAELEVLATFVERYGDALLDDGLPHGARVQAAGRTFVVRPCQELQRHIPARGALHGSPERGGSGPPLDPAAETKLSVDAPPPSGRPSPDVQPLLAVEHTVLVARIPMRMLAGVAPGAARAVTASEEDGAVPALAIKASKRDAQRAMAQLFEVDSLQLGRFVEDGRVHEVVLGVSDDRVLGYLSTWATTDDRPRVADLLGARPDGRDHALVVFLGGGAKRHLDRLRARDIVGVRVVRLDRGPG